MKMNDGFNTIVPAGMWSKLVKELAGNKCVICESTERLESHHILPRSIYPEYSYDLNNGICLCHRCHYMYHNGKWNSTGNKWCGIQNEPDEYNNVRDFRDNATYVLFPRGTKDRITALGFSVDEFIIEAVLSRIDSMEQSQGRTTSDLPVE